MIKHDLDRHNKPQGDHSCVLQRWVERQNVDGINSLKTNISAVIEYKSQTRIKVKTTPCHELSPLRNVYIGGVLAGQAPAKTTNCSFEYLNNLAIVTGQALTSMDILKLDYTDIRNLMQQSQSLISQRPGNKVETGWENLLNYIVAFSRPRP